MRKGWLFVAGLLATLVVAGVLSGFASSSPDGLEKVAEDKGVAAQAKDHDLKDSPFADYGVAWLQGERLGTAVAGVTGVLVTLAAGSLLFMVVRRRTPQAGRPEEAAAARPSQAE